MGSTVSTSVGLLKGGPVLAVAPQPGLMALLRRARHRF